MKHNYLSARYKDQIPSTFINISYHDGTKQGLVRCICDYIRFSGGATYRVVYISNMYNRLPELDQDYQMKIHVRLKGKSFKVMVSSENCPGTKQEKEGNCIKVSSFDEFLSKLNSLLLVQKVMI